MTGHRGDEDRNTSQPPRVTSAPDTRHLTEDEVDEVLIESAEGMLLEHLSTCALCQARVSSFTDAMAEFNHATLRWAESKSSTMAPVTPAAKGLHFGWSLLSPVAASLVIGAALLLHLQSTAAPITTHPMSTAELDPDPAQLARDNAMLEAINTEMQPAESPLMPYRAGAAQAATSLPQSVSGMRN